MSYVKAFIAGFFSTVIFHQGVMAVFNMFAVIPFGAYSMAPTKPLGVPSVLSLSFFAGLWGIVIWKLIEKRPRKSQIILATVLGAILPTVVAFVVVLPLKGVEFKPAFIPFALLLNGIWGLGFWLLLQVENVLISKSKV